MDERVTWGSDSHERKVERFYDHGVTRYADFHQGYLNFGLWEEGIKEYVEAAENLVKRLGKLLGLGQESQLLDVACGMGTQDVFLAQTFQPKSIDAVDLTWNHLQHGVRRAKEACMENCVQFHHGTAVALPFPDNHFTHVMSVEGPEHFDTREKFMHEARRVLKPGGVFAVSDYTLKRPPQTRFERLVVAAARKFWQVPRENVHSKEVYAEKLEGAGFRNITIEEIGALVIPGYFWNQMRPDVRKSLRKIRGVVSERFGIILDQLVYRAFTMGLMEYVLVRAEK